MSFAVGAAGALHTPAASFQALSIGGRPAAPAPSSGTGSYAPAGNLSHAASSAFEAILNINSSSSGPPVSFKVTAAPIAPVLLSAPSLPPTSKPQYVLPSNPTLVARLSEVARQIAINAIYPAPIFSFSV